MQIKAEEIKIKLKERKIGDLFDYLHTSMEDGRFRDRKIFKKNFTH